MMRESRRSLRCLVLAAAFAAALPATARPAAAAITTLKPGILQICLYPGFSPFSYKDGSAWKGWDYDYLTAFAKANDLHPEIVEVPQFDGIWLLPGQGRCDIAASGISDTEKRRQATGAAGAWSQTYYSVVRAYLVRTGSQVDGVEDFSGETVIVTGGSTADLDLRNRMQQAGIDDVVILATNSETAAADLARRGCAFAYGGGYGSVLTLARSGSGLKVVWPHCNMTQTGTGFTPYAEPFSFVVRAQSTGVPAALDAYICSHAYEGTPNPPQVVCNQPPWAPRPCSRLGAAPGWDTIKTYFKAQDIGCMCDRTQGNLNLGCCTSVRAWASKIYQKVSTHEMPLNGTPWTQEMIANFYSWWKSNPTCPSNCPSCP